MLIGMRADEVAAATLNLDIPADSAPGDLVVVNFGSQVGNGVTAPTLPAGFTSLASQASGPSAVASVCAFKFLTGGEAQVSSTATGATLFYGIALTFRNVNRAVNPILVGSGLLWTANTYTGNAGNSVLKVAFGSTYGGTPTEAYVGGTLNTPDFLMHKNTATVRHSAIGFYKAFNEASNSGFSNAGVTGAISRHLNIIGQ